MEISETSFRHLLEDICEAVSRKESGKDYSDLLRKIFDDTAHADPKAQSQVEPKKLLSKLSSAVAHFGSGGIGKTLLARRAKALTDDKQQHVLGKMNLRPTKFFGDEKQQHVLGETNLRPEKFFGMARDHEKRILLSELIDPYNQRFQLSVIPILGGYGIGKTTLARVVYEDEVVQKHFELRVWVKADGQEFKLHHAAHGILKSAMGMSCSLDDMNELDEMVTDTLQSKRCLIVFDGIESMAEDSWQHMNQHWFILVDFGSKVLITTPSKDVADIVADQYVKLTQLTQNDGWAWYRYLPYDSSNRIKDILSAKAEHIECDSSDIVKYMSSAMDENLAALCRGIALLLKLVGSLMRYNSTLRSLLSSVDFSNRILLPPSDASVAILLCVWALPPHLRQCVAYCALFPKGYAMKKEKIIAMWIAADLVKPSPENCSLEYMANTYFFQLLCRSFFTDISRDQYGDVTEFQIPALIHKIAEDVARIVYKEKLGLIGSIGEDAGQLSLVLPLAGKYESEHMQTLILSPPLYSDGNLDHSLLEFKGLQSLDLSCSGIRFLSDDICALRELRYLNLSYTLIERLPDSIVNLSQLRTLDLSWCYHLRVLPRGMSNLTQMSHLDLSLCESLTCLPSGIGFVTSLTSVPLFVLGKDHDCAHLGELGRLNQLRGRLEIRNLENVREISEARDAKLYYKNLDHLGLSWGQNADNCLEVLKHLQPNQQLNVLELTGYVGIRFPRWISSIRSLIKISITDCGCEELPDIGQLPFLKELQLKGMANIKYFSRGSYGYSSTDVFPSLEQLGLYDMPKLSDWSSAGPVSRYGGSFPTLKTLTIEGCPQLRYLPTFVNHVIIGNCNDKIYTREWSSSFSSLLIRDMSLGISFHGFHGLGKLCSLKRLILFNIEGLEHMSLWEFDALEHFGILHCHRLRDISFRCLSSLQKLHVADCQNIESIYLVEEVPRLVELVVEDCPQLYSADIRNLHLLKKLIIRSCSKFDMDAEDLKGPEKLECLSISGCPRFERRLEKEPSLISHIRSVIMRSFNDREDFWQAPVSFSYGQKYNPLRNYKSKRSPNT